MTIRASAAPARCQWCGRAFTRGQATGRPRLYCRRSCRQRAYEARRRARELGAAEDDVMVSRRRTEELLDRLDVLGRALADVDRDLADGEATDDPRALRESLEWLRGAAREAVEQPKNSSRPVNPAGSPLTGRR